MKQGDPMRALITVLLSLALACTASAQSHDTIANYREILEKTPGDGATHYALASYLMDNGGDLDEAVLHFERARDLEFQPQGVIYRLSRINARKNLNSEALEQIETLAEGGFGYPGLFENQADYAAIADDPRFVAAVETMRAARFPCMPDERHHAFDFWIGDWTVTANDQFAGTNNISAMLGHCVIFEQWESATGGLGKSFNYYDPGYDHWRQIWISDSGSIIEFTGEARDGGIFYTAETVNPADGVVTHHKFEFTQYENGDVRQFWQTSTDAGESWSTIWDARDVPKE